MITTNCTSATNHLADSVSKSQLAKKLGVTRNTLLRFHRLYALEFIMDYYNSFPITEGRLIDDLPLNPYQQWVLSRLIQLYKNVPSILIQIELSKEDILESFDFVSFSRLSS